MRRTRRGLAGTDAGGGSVSTVTAIGLARQTETRSNRIIRSLLLLAGVLSSMVYVTADILCGLRYPGYSFTNQVISELSAIGAPTTALWAGLLQVYAILFAAFTIGIVRESRGNRRLRRASWLLVAFVLSGPLWSFFPMHQRGDAFTWTDAGHIALGGVMVLLLSAVIAAGAGALGRRFRVFSQVLVTVAFVAGVGTFVYVPRMIDQLPTPGVGVVERIFLYAFLLWIGVLAVALLRRTIEMPRRGGGRR
jgi:hypothetical membrane protein